MDTAGAQPREPERGQALIVALGAVFVLMLGAGVLTALGAALAAWQIVLAGHTAWLASNAARVAARAAVVGRDPGAAARGALPAHLRRGLIVKTRGDGRVDVRVRVPIVVNSTAATCPSALRSAPSTRTASSDSTSARPS